MARPSLTLAEPALLSLISEQEPVAAETFSAFVGSRSVHLLAVLSPVPFCAAACPVTGALMQLANNSESAELVASSLRYLASACAAAGADEALSKVANAGGIGSVLQAMRCHETDANIITLAVETLWSLASSTYKRVSEFLSGAVPALLHVCDTFEVDAGICTAALSALCLLVSSNDMEKESVVARGGVCTLVTLLKRHAAFPRLVASAATLLQALARLRTNRDCIAREGGIDSLVAGLSIHSGDHSVARAVVGAIMHLSRETENAHIVGLAGGLKVVVDTLVFHAASVSMARVGSVLLRALAAVDSNRAKIGGEGCAVALSLICLHPTDAHISAHSMGAVLGFSTEPSIIRAHHPEIVSSVVSSFTRHQHSVEVVRCGTALLHALLVSERKIDTLFVANGGLVSLLSLFILHGGDPSVAAAIAGTVATVAAIDLEQGALWVAAGGIEALVHALKDHVKDLLTAGEISQALYLVTTTPYATVALRCSGLEALVNTLSAHGATPAAKHITVHVTSLLAAIADDDRVLNALLTSTGVGALVAALRVHGTHPRVAEMGTSILAKLVLMPAAAAPTVCEAISDVMPVIVLLLVTHAANAATAEAIVTTVAGVAANGNSCAAVASHSGGLDAIVAAVAAHSSSPALACAFARLVLRISQLPQPVHKVACARAGCIPACLVCLRFHGSDPVVVAAVVGALAALALNPDNAWMCARKGAIEAALSLLQRHESDAAAASSCALLLAHMPFKSNHAIRSRGGVSVLEAAAARHGPGSPAAVPITAALTRLKTWW